MLRQKGWLIHTADGAPDFGGFKDVIGPNIDTTNPGAAKWWWESIRDRYVKPYGFDYIWLDETEPDIDPAKDFFYVGSGTRYYNVYPLVPHSFGLRGLPARFRRQSPGDDSRPRRVSWSATQWHSVLVERHPSDLGHVEAFNPRGIELYRQRHALLGHGYCRILLAADSLHYHAAHTPLVDPSDARENVEHYEDYPELFVRWFQWGVFQPVMRAHGERSTTRSGHTANRPSPSSRNICVCAISCCRTSTRSAYHTYQTGAPFMRALFMDFPHDPNVVGYPATNTCSARLFSWRRSGAGSDQPQGLSAGGMRLV